MFVEFSFIRSGWRKTPRYFSLFVPPVRRCSSYVVGIFAVRSIAPKIAEKQRKGALGRCAMRANNAAKKGGLTIVIDLAHTGIVSANVVHA